MLFRHTDIMSEPGGIEMVINDLLEKRGLTKYRLAVQAGIPHATLKIYAVGKPNWKSVLQKRYISWQRHLMFQWRF